MEDLVSTGGRIADFSSPCPGSLINSVSAVIAYRRATGFRFLARIRTLRRLVQTCYGDPVSLVSKGNYKLFRRKRGCSMNVIIHSVLCRYNKRVLLQSILPHGMSRCLDIGMSRCLDIEITTFNLCNMCRVISSWWRCFKPASHFSICS
jgi:hypothetical protein